MKTCPKCQSTNLVHIEYDRKSKHHWDGVSEIKCVVCGYRQGRWCGEELKLHEIEKPYCKGGIHAMEINLE